MNVLSMGNMLVEIVRPGLDIPLDRPAAFQGPFPSGDTIIYIAQVARLLQPADDGRPRCAYIGAVGADEFGELQLRRLRADGVDCSQIRILPQHSTGVAFNARFSDGSRRFLFHWRHSAAGQLSPDYVDADLLSNVSWLHLSGCNLAICDSARDACYRAMDCLPPGARLSFDPNIRPEVLGVEEIRALCRPAIERADLLLPSEGEATMLTGAPDDEAACRLWAGQGKLVALKRGAAGCTLYRGAERLPVSGFTVDEVDSTGAGDSFGAALTVALLEGMPLPRAGRFANAVGALAVTSVGPMEGAPTRAQVQDFLAAQEAYA